MVVGYRGASATLLFLRLTSSFYLEEGAGSIIKRSAFVSNAFACRDRLFDHVAVGWGYGFRAAARWERKRSMPVRLCCKSRKSRE